MRYASSAALLLCLACGSATSTPATSSASGPAAASAAPGTTSVQGLKAAMDAGDVVLIDVRTPQEYAGGHAPGAKNIPLSDLSSRISELDAHKDGEVHLICASGRRSAKATSMLAEAGFAKPINVEGGTQAWVAAGLPVE